VRVVERIFEKIGQLSKKISLILAQESANPKKYVVTAIDRAGVWR
jgi:hypothetical protein